MTFRRPDLTPLKIVVAGNFGVGKTTMIGAVSEIPPLSTEEVLTDAGASTDSLYGVEAKNTTTVALDFGRITFESASLEFLLFGTPGQQRFKSLWGPLTEGAYGAILLVDTRRLEDSFDVVDYFEHTGLPFVVAVNVFQGAGRYPETVVSSALRLSAEVPVVSCDARDRRSAADVLITLAEHVLASAPTPALDSRP